MSQSVSMVLGATETFGSGSTTATSTWTEIVAANPDRRFGVWIQNVTATADIMIVRPGTSLPGTGVTTGIKVKAAYTEASVLGNDSVFFLMTDKAVYAKDVAEATALDYVYQEV